MSIAQSESLKRDLTDKYVVVQSGVAELRRFSGLTGQVKTVNMNGRALVEFDGPVDISWYDIDPTFLKVVDAPLPKAPKHAEKPAAAAKPAPKAASGKSPLEQARSQGAGGATKKLSPLEQARQQGAAGAAAPAKKLSPLELARQQGAAGNAAAKLAPAAPQPAPEPAPVAAEPEPAPEPTPAPEPVPAPAAEKAVLTQPGSTAGIIALARQQGPVKS